jgi:hypothetical protein
MTDIEFPAVTDPRAVSYWESWRRELRPTQDELDREFRTLPWWFHRWCPDAAHREGEPPTPDADSIRAHLAALGFVAYEYAPPRSRLDRIRKFLRRDA